MVVTLGMESQMRQAIDVHYRPSACTSVEVESAD